MKPRQYRVRGACCVALTLMSDGALAQLPDSPDPEHNVYPQVITPTRLKQALTDVPASVTVITADTIRRLGLSHIGDILRLVPGMAITPSTGNDLRANYHGAYAISPRRMNVLVDGVSVYRPAFSRVEWSLLPLALEDIDHIEVIRSPNSAAYGPNSMTAIINIFSKHPKDVDKGLASVALGSQGAVETTARLATTLGSTAVRLTANTQRDSGYDHISLPGDQDSTRVQRLNLRAQHDLADGGSLDVQASYVKAQAGINYFDPYQVSYPDQQRQDSQWSAKWTKALSATHELQVEAFRADAATQQQWRSCLPGAAFLPEVGALYRANPDYVYQIFAGQMPSGGSAQDNALALIALQAIAGMGGAALTPSCGSANQNGRESRTQLEIQDTYVASSALRFVAGLGIRYQQADSQTFFAGTEGSTVRWAFGHMESRPLDWLTANVGGYVESSSLAGHTFSPRIGINAHVSATQTLRAVISKGTRAPDLFEQRANWSYSFTNLTPTIGGASSARLALSAQAETALVSERIISRELGYMLNLQSAGLLLDAKVFDDRLSNLISDKLALTDFGPENNGAVRLSGAELQTTWDWSPQWSGLLSYGYLLNRDASSSVEVMQYSRHSGAIGISRDLGDGWRTSLAYYGASGNGYHEERYGRTDLSISRTFMLGPQSVSALVTLSYLDNPIVSTYQHQGMYFTSSYDSRFSIRGQCRITF